MPFLKITESLYEDKTYRYGLIVESVSEEGTPSHRTLKSLGPIETEEDLDRLEVQGRNARAAFEEYFTKDHSIDRYYRLLTGEALEPDVAQTAPTAN